MKLWNRCLHLTVLLSILAPAGMLTGCNKYTRYKVLTAVFDGVHHPDEAKKEVTLLEEVPFEDEEGRLAVLPVRYTHPSAGTEGGCALCHGTPKELVIPGKDICVKCHAEVREKKPFIHGPAVLDCIVCHDPHESKTKSLLKIIGDELCFECHYRKKREDAYKTEEHRELEGKGVMCLSCHDPHGGKNRFFVKEDQEVHQKDNTGAPPQDGTLEETVPRDGVLQREDRENDRVHETDTN